MRYTCTEESARFSIFPLHFHPPDLYSSFHRNSSQTTGAEGGRSGIRGQRRRGSSKSVDDEGRNSLWKEERLVSPWRHAKRYQAERIKLCAGSVSSRIAGRFQFHVKLFAQPGRFKASLKTGMHVRAHGTTPRHPWISPAAS